MIKEVYDDIINLTLSIKSSIKKERNLLINNNLSINIVASNVVPLLIQRNTMNTFLQNVLNTIVTANGAKTHKSSLNACLDLFSMGIGSANKEALIANALKEDPILAVKTILYLRDPRNGQGNKDIARARIRQNKPISGITGLPLFGALA